MQTPVRRHLDRLILSVQSIAIAGLFLASAAHGESKEAPPDVRVGAAAVNLRCDNAMVLAGMLEPRYVQEQEGELRAVAVVIEKPDQAKLAIVVCDVLWVPRDLADSAVTEIERTTGIPAAHLLINATHTHHAPSTAPAHGFGVSEKFREEVRKAIVRSVQEADRNCQGNDVRFFFHLGEEKTVGANSRLLLPDGNITWINPQKESAGQGKPTGPFDPQLPVFEFRDSAGKPRAILFNHSTHTIGTRLGRDCRSPGFYGLAAQELEQELGAAVSFLEGASGSTHNIAQVPVAECVERMKQAVRDARSQAEPRAVNRVAGIRRALKFRVRIFDDAEEDAKIARYTTKYTPQASDRIREIFSQMRKQLHPQQGEERETWVQALVIGDVALVGVPAEYFTTLGVDIKRRSPFKHTFVAELANDWIGYLPDREGHRLGGYQTWMGLHSYAEVGTGERVADLAVTLLQELAAKSDTPQAAASPAPPSVPVQHKLAAKGAGAQSVADERRSFQFADPRLTIEPVAAEPDVESPVAIAWDSAGRLYVAEMPGYPETPMLGRIRILSDKDADGAYESSMIFADGLNFPASVMPFRDGVLVADAPDIQFLRDTDGDDRADERQVLWTGFVPGSQQLRANSLHWGIDNWIYGANGRCDGEIRRPEEPNKPAVSIRGRDFRFRGGQFQAIVGQSQFGQAHDDWGNRFLSWNTIPVRQALIEERYLDRRPNLSSRAVIDLAAAEDTGRVFGLSLAPRQFNAERADHYNALCGLSVFRGDGLGEAYAGNAFVGESLSNLITRRVLLPAGSTFVATRAEQGQEFLASRDPWFHPVNLATGPDGCLYVVDFYRELVEHPLYVASPELRDRIEWRHGHTHGRLWRIRRTNFPIPVARHRVNLNVATDAQLVTALAHPVGWWRDTAQRLLVERNATGTESITRDLLRQSTIPVARLHALRTLEGIGVLNDTDVVTAIRDANSQVRRHALQLAEERFGSSQEVRDAALQLSRDPDPGVRFQLALSLGTMANVPHSACLELIERTEEDLPTLLAVLSNADAQVTGLLQEYVTRNPARLNSPTQSQLEFLNEAGRLFGSAPPSDQTKHFAQGLREGHAVGNSSSSRIISPGAMVLLAGILEGRSASGSSQEGAAAEGSADEGCDRLARSTNRKDDSILVRSAGQMALDVARPEIVREAALRLLQEERPDGTLEVTLTVLRTTQGGPLQAAAARAVARWHDASALRAIFFDDWPQLSSSARRAVLSASVREAAATDMLLEAVEQKRILPVELPLEVDAELRRSADAQRRDRAERLLGSAQSSDRAPVVERLRPALALEGDRQRGAQLFRQHCLSCHSMQGLGRRVGPDLSGIGARSPESLLVDLLDPSRQVVPDFIAYAIVRQDGRLQTGLVAAETTSSVTIRQAEGDDVVIPRDQIEALRATGKSLMPDGIEQKVDVQGLADLLAFLRAPDRELLRSE